MPVSQAKDKTDFSFSTLEKVIATHGVKKTNEYLSQCILLKNIEVFNANMLVKAIIEAVCVEFEITPIQLMQAKKSFGAVQEARQLCACIFHFELGYSVRIISFQIFKREFHLFVQNGIRKHKKANTTPTQDKSKKYIERYARITKSIQQLLTVK